MSVRLDPRLARPEWSAASDPARERRVRLLLVADVLLAVWYFGWLLQPQRVGTPWVYAMLVTAELFNLALAAGFWWTLSHTAVRLPADPPESRVAVDVLIPTVNEAIDVIGPVVAAATRLRGADVTVWVLDDSDREPVRRLAEHFGARYLHRPWRWGAKAGNLNYALDRSSAPFVAVFDCDHVPSPRFLEATLGRFRNPALAFVQTPQYYANSAHNNLAAAAWAQQALFFGSISRAKDARGVMLCAGTNFVIRREALDSVGGFPTSSVTEDFLLSVRLAERGWHSAYEREVLASGLAPEDLGAYRSQQRRWARGCVGLITRIMGAKVPWRFKLSSLFSTMFFLSGWAVLANMTWPVIWAVTGDQPLASVSADQFLLHFAPFFTATLATVGVAAAGRYTWSGYALAVGNFWTHISTSASTLAGNQGRFVVTPKQDAGGWQPRACASSLIAAAILTIAIVFGLARGITVAALNNAGFALLHVTVLLTGARFGLRWADRSTARERAIDRHPSAQPSPTRRLATALDEAAVSLAS